MRKVAEGSGPGWLAVLGVTAYRAASPWWTRWSDRSLRSIGPTRLRVLPNPSGLNAHWSPAQLADAFAQLRDAAGG